MTDHSTERSPKSSSGNLWVVVPFVLAVIGTVVMLFTNSANALKIALIFALWAAVAGIMVIDRTRRDRDAALATAATREAELAQARSQLEVQAEEHATAQATGQVPATVTGSAEAHLQASDLAVLRELQEEIKALRSQLEELRGQVFEYEPAAVRASARRIQEIEEPKPAEPVAPSAPAEPVEPAAPVASRPGPSSDETTRIAKVNVPEEPREQVRAQAHEQARAQRTRPAGAPSAAAISGRIGQQPTYEHPNPLSTLISERTREQEAAQEAVQEAVQPEPVVKPVPTPEPEPAAEPTPEPKPDPQPEPEQEPEVQQEEAPRRGGRRRRDEHTNAISVAELLARRAQNAQSEQNKPEQDS